MANPAYAELHCHTEFSFLDGASSPDELVERAVQLGLTGLAVTDHQGLYGAVRFAAAARAAGLHPVVGVEIELLDPAVPDPGGFVVPARGRAAWAAAGGAPARGRSPSAAAGAVDGMAGPAPCPDRARLPGHRERSGRTSGGSARRRGPHLVLLARDMTGYRSLCRLVSGRTWPGRRACRGSPRPCSSGTPRGSSRCRAAGTGRSPGGCWLATGRGALAARAVRAAVRHGRRGRHGGGFFLELQHHLLPDDDWLVAETARLPAELGLPVVVTNDVHYALPEDRELQDVLMSIRHGLTLDETLADLRRPNGESHLKGAAELLAMPPGDADADAARPARAWRGGDRGNAVELAARCRVDLGFERYRFPGFAVPKGRRRSRTSSALCHEGARRRYHPLDARRCSSSSPTSSTSSSGRASPSSSSSAGT